MKGIDSLALAVKRIFRQQRAQWRSLGKARFGDWNSRLAAGLREAMDALYLSAARSAKAKSEHADQFVALSRARAWEVANSVNATTNDMLARGDNPWTDERIAQIALTEASHAKWGGITEIAGASGKNLRWKRGRREPCDFCKTLVGRKTIAGVPFAVHNGVAIYHPPAHPHCFCSVEVV